MDVEDAKKLKYSQRVDCPADRGEPAFIGTVRTRTETIKNSTVHKNIRDEEYIWVEVQQPGPGQRKALWPSNRLGWSL